MAQGSSGAAMIAAAVILSGSFVGGSYLVSGSIDRGADQLANLKSAAAANPAAQAAPTPSPTRARRPDSNQVYAINVGSSPTRGGAASAPITIIEWSDFQ